MKRFIFAMPTLLRIGFASAVAYRAEMFIWVLATTMPLVMLMLWTAVAEVAPVAGASHKNWGSSQFVAYFLSTFIVRQLISAWAAWEMNYEVRQGILSMRLLRPLHPILSFASENIAALPLRAMVTVPIALILAFSVGAQELTRDWRMWLLLLAAMLGGWLITFFANICIGCLSLYFESSIKIMDIWLAAFFVFSGYLFPSDLFPDWLRAVAVYLPFRFQIGLPVELVTNQHSFSTAFELLARQYAWATGFVLLSLVLWRGGVKRFQAVGG